MLNKIFQRKLITNHINLKLNPFLQQNRWISVSTASNKSLPTINTGVLFVPQQEAYVVERFGKFLKILQPGLNLCIPIVDRVAYVQVLKEIAIDIPDQSAITLDNVVLQLNGVLYLKIKDAYNASYGVEDAEFAVTQLAQTTMRSEIGKIALDSVFKEREMLNINIVMAINKATESWGIECLRYEIKDINLPEKIQISMQLQVEAERKKRAAILESEGHRDAEINRAEAMKRSSVLESEGVRIENINRAEGESQALMLVAKAKAESIKLIADAIAIENGTDAVQLNVAEKYITEFGKIAGTNNTLMMSSPINDVSAMVTQAMTIYNTLDKTKKPTKSDLSTSSKSTKPPGST